MYAKDTPPLSIRAKQDLIDKLTQMAVERGTTRTKLINEALAFYVNTKECVKCGAVNPGEGKRCTVCGADLFTDEEIKNTIEIILFEFSTNSFLMQKLVESNYEGSSELILKYLKSYAPLLKFKIDRTEGNTNYVVSLSFYDKDGLVFTPSGVNCDFCLNKDDMYSYLCSWRDEHKEDHKTE